MADAIFYQIFPDRFAKSTALEKPSILEPWDSAPTMSGYKGGNLLGIVEHLDWIEHIECTAIYLNPIFQSTSNHRYHTHDYFRVDPLLGGDQAFRTLLEACHERGIKVILDGVFNHASRGFFQFNDILEQEENSPWQDWFHIHGFPLNAYDQRLGPSQYEAWWDMPALPVFNTENPAVREYLMRVGEYWIEQGIDGWRLDVPEEISTEGFWEEFRRRVRAKNPDAYIVGEIWGDASSWTVDSERFDGTMNYLLTGYNVSFASGNNVNWHVADGLQYHVKPMDAAEYEGAVRGLFEMYPGHSINAHLNVLGSHDTARLLTVAGHDVASVKLAALLTFTFPGAPCVYYGDEIGLDGAHDPASRARVPLGLGTGVGYRDPRRLRQPGQNPPPAPGVTSGLIPDAACAARRVPLRVHPRTRRRAPGHCGERRRLRRHRSLRRRRDRNALPSAVGIGRDRGRR